MNWRLARLEDERDYTHKSLIHSFLDFCFACIDLVFQFPPIENLLKRSLLDFEITDNQVVIPNLIEELEDFKILHLSDLHIDRNPYLAGLVAQDLVNLDVDLIVITGDIVDSKDANLSEAAENVSRMLSTVNSKYGTYAVLGNHDTYSINRCLRSHGIHLLMNETIQIDHLDRSILITGLDDVHEYYTPEASLELKKYCDQENDLKICLVHSPEIIYEASNCNYDLYLTGHTHGGQICLPGGIPICKQYDGDRRFVKGAWQCEDMVGYTSRGLGASGITLRTNCSGEISIHTIRRK